MNDFKHTHDKIWETELELKSNCNAIIFGSVALCHSLINSYCIILVYQSNIFAIFYCAIKCERNS